MIAWSFTILQETFFSCDSLLESICEYSKVICKPRHCKLGTGIGLGSDVMNAIISTSIRLKPPKLSRVATQDEGTTTTKSRGHMTNKKRYISTFTRPMNLKLSQVVTQDKGTTPPKSRDTSITWSYLHFPKTCRPQTYHGGDLRWGEPTHRVTLNLDLVVYVTNQKYFIFTFTRRKAHKFSRMVTRVRRTHAACHVSHRSRHHVTTIQ